MKKLFLVLGLMLPLTGAYADQFTDRALSFCKENGGLPLPGGEMYLDGDKWCKKVSCRKTNDPEGKYVISDDEKGTKANVEATTLICVPKADFDRKFDDEIRRREEEDRERRRREDEERRRRDGDGGTNSGTTGRSAGGTGGGVTIGVTGGTGGAGGAGGVRFSADTEFVFSNSCVGITTPCTTVCYNECKEVRNWKTLFLTKVSMLERSSCRDCMLANPRTFGDLETIISYERNRSSGGGTRVISNGTGVTLRTSAGSGGGAGGSVVISGGSAGGNGGGGGGGVILDRDDRWRCSSGSHPSRCFSDYDDIRGRYSRGGDCVNCGPGGRGGYSSSSSSSTLSGIAEIAGAVMPGVAALGVAYINGRAVIKSNEAWAGATARGFEQCRLAQQDYLNYLQNNELPGMTPTERNGMNCNGYQMNAFAGLGGQFNPYLNAGYSPGFINGVIGPYAPGVNVGGGINIGIGGGLYNGGAYGGGFGYGGAHGGGYLTNGGWGGGGYLNAGGGYGAGGIYAAGGTFGGGGWGAGGGWNGGYVGTPPYVPGGWASGTVNGGWGPGGVPGGGYWGNAGGWNGGGGYAGNPMLSQQASARDAFLQQQGTAYQMGMMQQGLGGYGGYYGGAAGFSPVNAGFGINAGINIGGGLGGGYGYRFP